MVHQKVPPRDASAGPRPHHVSHYLKIAAHIGADVDDPTLFDPPASEVTPEPLRIGISPGAEYGPAKCWPAGRFAEAAKRVADKKPGARFALFGTKSEAAIGDALAAELGPLADNRVGKTDLVGLIEELRGCSALITNDTGTMHLAAFLGVPVIAIFGSTEPAWTGPLGKGHRVLRHHVPCSPCFLRECPLDFSCMTSITAEEVAASTLDVLEERS